MAGSRHRLPDPFFVLATQNPIEQEGTYPLPEAQQDRFMFNIRVDYPDEAEETRIVEATTSVSHAKVERVIGVEEILALQMLVLKIPAAKYLVEYATRLVKKALVGTGGAEKAQVQAMLKVLLPGVTVAGADAADALAVAIADAHLGGA